MEPLRLSGAREHNLAGVDLTLAHGRWIAVVGPSGSGKTSLVFDTLVREGQRRFLGSLSARARQFFGKLGRADVEALTGLPAPVAVGAALGSSDARSTVGTRTGALDLLRLLFARGAVDPAGEALTRSHFTFARAPGACEACGGSGVEDVVDPGLLVADPSKSIRAGALVPTLKSGYTVYSQVTLDVMDTICRAHGFDVETPWRELSEAQRNVVLYGTKALKVPFGKHPIESRMRWEGITAKPREEGYYRGLVPVITETLQRDRNPNVLRFVRTAPCGVCAGTRLARAGREARVGDATLPELLALPARALPRALDALPASAVLDALRPSLDQRLDRMQRLGLGHLTLARTAPTLSGGETQRLQLVAQLSAGLGRQLVALDEPTLGLHPETQAGMRSVLEELRSLGNTVLVVEHDPDLVRCADHLVALGPGAGVEGGRVTFDGAPPADPLGPAPTPKPAAERRAGTGTLSLVGATLHGLRDARLDLPLGTLHVVLGPSGAGKSSLVFGTLLPALTGARDGGPYERLEGAPAGRVQAEDARPIGRTPRSTPATWSGLFDLVRKRFAATEAANERGLTASHFSFNTKVGRCPTCEGLGFERVTMHLLADLELPCSACGGGRYAPEVLEVTLDGRTIADVLRLTVREACDAFADDPPARALVRAMDDLGLGYLQLGQASNSLSRGEAQRVKLATLLGRTDAKPTLLLLDEPDRGLHPYDVALLLRALDRLVDAGHTVLAISHHRHLWAAADGWTELREGVARRLDDPPAFEPSPPTRAREPAPGADSIRLRGARARNLRGVDVELPHAALSVLAGVSGSGKSSLAHDTLAAEAWARFAESLPFQVRRFARRLPRPALDAAEGLGPTLALRQEPARAGGRSSVGTQSELAPLLRLLWSRAGAGDDAPRPLTAEHFDPDRPLGACPTCEGRGVVPRCDPGRLVTDPERPLADGACAGTKPGKHFTDPDGQHVATLHAAAPHVDWSLPWRELPEGARRLALEGAGERVVAVEWRLRAGTQEGKDVHRFAGTWDGLLRLVEREATRRAHTKAAAAWAEPLVDAPCPACAGARLRPELAAVTVGGLALHETLARPLEELLDALDRGVTDARQREVYAALRPELAERLAELVVFGLGHLSLDRPAATLSDGELQRVRLAGVLRAELTGVTLVLDEPGAGLHAHDLDVLVERLRAACAAGNTVVAVSHRPALLRAADHLVELGPGSGAEGGSVVAAGAPAEVLAGNGPTGSALRAREHALPKAPAPLELHVRGARANNLRALDVDLPASGFVAVSGVSGSGKSTLLFDVLAASLTDGEVRPTGCDALEGFERFRAVRSSRALGRGGTPLTALGLATPLQRLYHAAAGDTVLPARAFSYQSPAGRCEACGGSGIERVALDFLADLALPCPACEGKRYRPEVLEVLWNGLDVARFLAEPAASLLARVPAGKLHAGLQALVDVGLGHVALGRERATLSGGESQRLAIAEALLAKGGPTLFLLDEPAKGLHEADLARLLVVFDRLARRGDLVVASEHRLSLLAAADHVLDLGPGGGPAGGTLVAQGPPDALESGATAEALRRRSRER